MTTTLTEARRALLELQLHCGPRAAKIITDRLAIIAAYMDEQVALNIENLPSQRFKATAEFQPIPPDRYRLGPIGGGGPLLEAGKTYTFVAGGDAQALKPELGDRRFFTLGAGGAINPPSGPSIGGGGGIENTQLEIPAAPTMAGDTCLCSACKARRHA